jgi:CRP/FNR family cyclic AMP-dependent transcriptional regulator
VRTAHATCVVLSQAFRGRLCEQLAGGPARTLEAGQLLYTVGQPAESVYLVRRGLVKTSLVSRNGQEMTLRIHPAGDVLGELCVCTGERREQAAALAASEVVEIPMVALLRRVRQDPQGALDFASLLCEHLAAAHEGLRSLSFDPVTERLGRALLELADRLGEDGAEGVRIGHYISQEELAQMIGARREVVSGLLNRLRTGGMITYTRRGHIEIRRAALEAYLETLGES